MHSQRMRTCPGTEAECKADALNMSGHCAAALQRVPAVLGRQASHGAPGCANQSIARRSWTAVRQDSTQPCRKQASFEAQSDSPCGTENRFVNQHCGSAKRPHEGIGGAVLLDFGQIAQPLIAHHEGAQGRHYNGKICP